MDDKKSLNSFSGSATIFDDEGFPVAYARIVTELLSTTVLVQMLVDIPVTRRQSMYDAFRQLSMVLFKGTSVTLDTEDDEQGEGTDDRPF